MFSLLELVLLLITFTLCWGVMRLQNHQTQERTCIRNRVPFGYTGIPGVGFLPNFKGLTCQENLIGIRKKYGKICKVRMGSYDIVWLNDYHIIKEAWTNSSLCGRPNIDGISLRTKGFKGGIIFNDGKDFSEQRRFVMHTLKSIGLGKAFSEQIILQEIHDLICTLKNQAGKPISTQHLFNIPAFNIIWGIVSGGSRFKHDDPAMLMLVEVLNRNMILGDGACAAFFMPWLSRYFPRIIGWNKYISDANFIFEFWKSCAKNAMKEHQSNLSEDGVTLPQNSVLWKYCDKIKECLDPSSSFYGTKGGPARFHLSLATVLQDLFIAGSETTATTLQWICLYLAAFPACQEKVSQEIKSILDKYSHLDELVTLASDDRESMLYTEAFIKESLRYSTLAPLGMLHCAMEDCHFQGFYIPKGTLLQMNACAVHFDEKYWRNPHEFKPERFFTSKDEVKLISGEIPGFVPFSLGKRMCPGAEVARQTLFLATISILRKFQICADNSDKTPDSNGLDLRPIIGVSAMPCPHKLKFIERCNNA